ncbi:MAG: hypothetical protein AAFY11_04225 [Cyanobacteria bacterium J06641_5]
MYAPTALPRPRRQQRRPPAPRQSARPAPRQRQQSARPVSLPSARSQRGLKLLVGVQRLTTAVAIGAVGVALGTYSLTVCQWQAWNQAERQLQELRYQERSLQRSGAALEASLAADAERSPLVLWDPKQTLFVKAAPAPQPTVPVAAELPPLTLSPSEQPLAY